MQALVVRQHPPWSGSRRMRRRHTSGRVASLTEIRMGVPPLDKEPLWEHLVGPRCKPQASAQGRSNRVPCDKASRDLAVQSGGLMGWVRLPARECGYQPGSVARSLQYRTSICGGSLTASLCARPCACATSETLSPPAIVHL